MKILFKEDYLLTMYRTGKSDKKHRFQADIIRRYIRVVDLMTGAPHTEALMRFPSLHYERLGGKEKGLSSVRVNNQYRIEFEEYTKNGETKATICKIVELSNHYQ